MTLLRIGAACTALIACALARPAAGQNPAFEAAYGVWFADDTTARLFHAGVVRRALGPFGWGVAFVHVQDTRDSLSRTLSGGELSLSLWRDGSGPYAVGSAGLGIVHRTGASDAFWTLGGGWALRLFSLLSLGIETRYRVEDTRARGFWQLDPADRNGFQVQGRVSFGFGSGERGAVPSPSRRVPDSGARAPAPATSTEGTAPRSPLPANVYGDAVAAGATEEAARLTASVVETALASMGSPYRWGGTDANGFDCSGLIQYAYGQHGIVLPRTSRDQARLGRAVDRRPEALRPGDVLAFSASGTSQVTHVGLYLGDGQFIHSSSTGVKLSSLRADDGDARWWKQRWVGARRIVE